MARRAPGGTSVHDLVLQARDRLIRAGIPDDEAGPDAEVLARFALGWARADYLGHRLEPAPPFFDAEFDQLVLRREQREPVSLIIGRREFWGRTFEVNRAVLTPRPETELIVAEALAELQNRGAPVVADAGTGCGCLAVTLALERDDARITGTDLSADALAVARRNAERHGVANRVLLQHTDLLDGIAGPFDLIVSNPPYVPASDVGSLPPEVREHEPAIALFGGGGDGLDITRRLAREAAARLVPGGRLIVEIGIGREAAIRALAADVPGLSLLRIRPDLQGIPRTAVFGYSARRPRNLP